MATANKGFDENPIPGTSFTRLLDSGDHASLDMVETGSFIFPAEKAPKMLCFGNPCNQVAKGFGDYGMIAQRSGITGSDSSSVSSSNHSSSTGSFSNPKSKSETGEAKTVQKKRNGSSVGSVPSSSLGSGASGDYRKTSKKVKTENLSSKVPAKARKEKLGERITALQQLVSPFGKTDTASVLHEAMGYIRFLHDQVQVLSSPYMQRLPSSAHGRNLHEIGKEEEEKEEEESKYELRSRGLCLVPVACTVHMANSNGADYWSLAMASNSNPKQ